MNKLADYIVKRMEGLVGCIAKRKAVFIASSLLLVVLTGWGMGRLEYRSILEGELPKDDQIVRTNQELKAVFGDKSYVTIAVNNDQGIINSKSLDKIIQISEELKNLPQADKEGIISLATLTTVENSSDNLLLKPLLSKAPETEKELAVFAENLRYNSLAWKRLVSADLTTVMINAPVAKTASEKEVYDAVIGLAQKYQGPEKIYYYSFQVIDQAIDQGINYDLTILFPLAIFIICVLLFLSFGNVRSAILPVLTMVMAVISTIGAMGWLGYKFSTATSIIPVLIVTLGSSYCIYLLYQFFTADEKDRVSSLMLIINPMLQTAAVSAVGFFTLYVFKIDSIREFGFFAGMSIVFIAYYVLFFFLPMLYLLPQKKKTYRQFTFFAKLTDKILKVIWAVSAKTRWVGLVACILIVLSVWGISLLRVGSNPTKFFPSGHQVRATSEIINSKFKGTGVIEVMFEAKEEYGIIKPETLRQIWGFQKYCEGLNTVGNTFSVIDPLRYMNKALNGAEEIPQSMELAAQYLLLYGSDQSADLSSLVDLEYKRLKVTIWMYIDDSQIIAKNYEAMQAYLAKNLSPDIAVKFGGENMEWIAQNKYIVNGKISNIITSTLIILPIFAIIFRSIGLGFLAILPLSFSTLIVFGVMGFLGIRLDYSSCIISSVSLGLGVDFTIHYIHRFLEIRPGCVSVEEAKEKVAKEVGKPILFDALANTLGFTALFFSSFTPIRDFGWLIVLNMVACALGTLIFLPALIGKFKEVK